MILFTLSIPANDHVSGRFAPLRLRAFTFPLAMKVTRAARPKEDSGPLV
jgi:hypothetical protein